MEGVWYGKMGTIRMEVEGNKDGAIRIVSRRWIIIWILWLPLWFIGRGFLPDRAVCGRVTRLPAYVAVVAFGCVSRHIRWVVYVINVGVARGELAGILGRGVEQSRGRNMKSGSVGGS
jgi:hypothetical protein